MQQQISPISPTQALEDDSRTWPTAMQDEQLENYVVRGRLKRAANGDYLDIRRTSSGKAWTVLLPYRQDGTLTQRSFSSWVEAALALGKARSRWWDDDEPVLAHHKKKR